MLLLLVCTAFHDTLYDVPNHGSCWPTPALVVVTSLVVANGNRKLDGGISWLFALTPALTVGRYAPSADATFVSLICGSSRAARRSTFASIAIFTASSTERRTTAGGSVVGVVCADADAARPRPTSSTSAVFSSRPRETDRPRNRRAIEICDA